VWSDLAHHVRRFFRGFRWALSPEEVEEARALLTADELALFSALQGRERRHAMDMLHWLQTHTTPSRELQAAALVHNVGKGPLHLHERVIYVLLQKFAPPLLARLASPRAGRLGRTLAMQAEHAPRGAERLAAIGSAARVRALVRHHHDASPGRDRELAWLMEADSRR
jgi:hypothetical protein